MKIKHLTAIGLIAITMQANVNFMDVQFYRNGSLSVQTYTGSNATINTSAAGIILVTKLKDGYMSDFRYYDYALTADEIQNIYNINDNQKINEIRKPFYR